MCRDGGIELQWNYSTGGQFSADDLTKGGERYDPPRLGAGSGNQLYSSQHSGRDHQTLVKKKNSVNQFYQ